MEDYDVNQEYLSTEVTDEDLAEAWEDEYGVRYSRDRKRLLRWNRRGLYECVVIDGTKAICNGAFRDCGSLASIKLPDSLTLIEDYAFKQCESLISINLPNRLTSIESWAFDGCQGLISITLPEGILSVGWGLFDDCSRLQEICVKSEPNSDVNAVDRKFKNIFPSYLWSKIRIMRRN